MTNVDPFRMLAAAGAAIAFSLAVWSFAWGWADLGTVSARVSMEGWQKSRRPVAAGEWASARDGLARARRINPFSADYSADLGRLHEWQALQGPVDGPRARAHRGRALAYYEEALARRPTWGLAWANRARNQLLLDGLDRSAAASLATAARLAPWAPDVQALVLWPGLALWDRLPPDLRSVVADTVRRAVAMDNEVDLVIGAAVQYGWVDRLRPMLVDEAHRRRLDERLAARP